MSLVIPLVILVLLKLTQSTQLQIPKDREGFFNRTSYVKISPPLSLHNHISLSYRTCVGGQLFLQTYPQLNNRISMEVLMDGLIFTVLHMNKVYETKIETNFLDNVWHTVNVIYQPGSIIFSVSKPMLQKTVANSTYNSELLNPDIPLVTDKNAKLIVGEGFVGCLLEGPSLVFNSTYNQAYNVEWGSCPLVTNGCTQVDYCANEPCMMHGTCISRADRYQCICAARYSGNNCEIDNGSPCKKGNVCLNNGRCEEDKIENYVCICEAGYTGTHCETEIGSKLCENNPCHNNGVCHVLPPGDRFECICTSGSPPNCTEMSVCSNSPCLNGGICSTTYGEPNCTCPPGFSGKFCQMNIDECASSPCQNGGTCLDGINGYKCNCTEDFMGPTCQMLYDACAFAPCRNNGTCYTKSSRKEYYCECIKGFEGINCENNVNDCIGITCPPGKMCVDGINSYECRCPPGFTGEDCSKSVLTIQRCNSATNLCLHGICVDTANGYMCNCGEGYTGAHCDIDIDECKQNVCKHGYCMNTEGSYQCFCTPGFTGDHCDIDFDECLSNPCYNGATCINGINKFNCICTPGYTGKDCHIDINECDPNPCLNNGICNDGNATFSCSCPPGWVGTLCDINIDDCESSPCQNGGKCLDGINTYTCDCTGIGFTGLHCEINVDDCVNNPCVNNASCVDLIKDYRCICFPGYAGKNCEEDINECENNPCQYGGTCLERSKKALYHLDNPSIPLPAIYYSNFSYFNAEGYECICTTGLTGNNCEININDCESNPCKYGKCIDEIGRYICECEDGFEGPHCEIDVDECERYKPCINGMCFDRRAGYFCDCPPKYGGKNCSVELIGCNQEPACLNNGVCKPYLVGENEHKFSCTCPSGFHGAICNQVTTMSLSGESHIVVNTTREEGYDISFRFRTTLPNGVLAIGKGITLYILKLVNGRLNLHSSLLNKWEGVFIGSQLNDSNWQKVFVAINSSHVVLSANEEQTIYPINLNEGTNSSYSSFPTTYIGGTTLFRQLTQGPVIFVGCMENIVINGQWVIPQETMGLPIEMEGVEIGCPRRDQCYPNPCQNGGECTDLWRNFSCICQRPFLGSMCQYSLPPATFGHENVTNSLVTVNVWNQSKRVIRNIVHISMFIRTRQLRGAIFYLGSNPGSVSFAEETYIAAELEGGELLVRIQFNGMEESYTVGGIKLNNGQDYLIEVIRSITLVQVKIRGTEYFRKTIGASGLLDAQVLYLGGYPSVTRTEETSDASVPQQRTGRQAIFGMKSSDIMSSRYTRQTAERFANVPHFKGVIQDVQVSNGSFDMAVEFFPLLVEDLVLPKPFGNVTFNPETVLQGVLSDDTCRSDPCLNGGKCTVTWNDYVCECPLGYKGKQCEEMEFCQLQGCPEGSECRNLHYGHECVTNVTLNGSVKDVMQYSLVQSVHKPSALNSVEIMYRSKTGGTLLHICSNSAQHDQLYFSVFVHKDQISVLWKLEPRAQEEHQKIRKDHPDGEWTNIVIKMADNKIHASFAGVTDEPGQYFVANNFSSVAWNSLISTGIIYIGAGEESLQEKMTSKKNMYTYDNVNSNIVDVADVVSSTDETSVMRALNLGAFYKGCAGEIRIGGLLLPYFTAKQLNINNATEKDYFVLKGDKDRLKADLGCYLCFPTDCKNGGKCLNATESYSCECAPGFDGEDCSNNIDECEGNKCQHGATCVDGIAGYTCHCSTGWTGAMCDIDIDECASRPCQNNGTCIDRLGFYECNCTDEFVGKQCEYVKQITCNTIPAPCKNDATCTDVLNLNTGDNFTCSCTEGFVGRYCEDTFCSVKPCRNRGLCIIRNKIPVCECTIGFKGKYCEENIDDCAPAPDGTPPCLHNGRCIDGIASYACNCTNTGYTGERCDVDINECVEGTARCGDKGTCENLEGSYKCVCEKNVCGLHCDLYDPCMEMPCQNGGTCHEKCTDQQDYECICTAGYVGKNCTELLLYVPDRVADIALILGPVVVVLLIAGGVGLTMFVMMARKKRATRGTYSPSSQEYSNPRVELDNVMKPPPEERLI